MSILKTISKWFEGEEPIVPEPTAPEPAWTNPLDSMPVANGSNRYAPPERLVELESELNRPSWEDTAPSEYEPPDEEWFNEGDQVEQEKTMHQKMYEMATARYNPFSLGGSENCDSDISCNSGGSENAQKL